MSWLRTITDDKHPIKAMALLVRRAGLEHLIVDPDPEELAALAAAGDELHCEYVAYLLYALRNQAEALKSFDGGAAVRAEVKAQAYALSRQT